MASITVAKDFNPLYLFRVALVFNSIKEASKDGNTELVDKLADFGANLTEQCDPYSSQFSDEPSPYVNDLIEHSKAIDWDKLYVDGLTKAKLMPQFSAGTYEGIVLQTLARTIKPKRVLEIGMFIGASTLALANLPYVEKVVTLDIEPYLEQIAKPFWEKAGVAQKITPIFDDAVKSLNNLVEQNEEFDFIFMDAPGFLDYYEIIMNSGLLAKNGMIVKDDSIFLGVLWTPKSDLSAMDKYLPDRVNLHHNFNERVKNDDRVNVLVLPVRNGISIITRKE